MKKRIVSIMLVLTLAFGLTACSGETENETDKTNTAGTTEEKETPETAHIKWGRGMSGNALVTVAKKLGYFEEYGLEVEEIDMESGASTALSAGQIDIVSNDGTVTPLQQIAAGEEFTIFGGHMLTGCTPIVAKPGTEWNGVESFVGKTVVGASAATYSFTGPLLELGYNPSTDVNWMSVPTQADRVAAVISGEADYAALGTGIMYELENMIDSGELEILCYQSDIMPNYSCCRMFTRTNFIEENPITFKLLLKALIRAQAYYEANKEEVVAWTAENIGATEEYVSAYMLNDDYRVNADPIKNPVLKAWSILEETGILDENAAKIDIEEHINTELYKKALDELMGEEEIYNENKEFFDTQLKFFEENNL